MRKSFLLTLFLAVATLVSAQEHYKFVIIPTTFPSIGDGIDPYGTSGAIQQSLNEKGIPCFFESSEHPLDPCDGLRVKLEKGRSLLRNKVEFQLTDCMNRTIWESEGVGMSKEFREGYGEAIADALKDLEELPVYQYEKPQAYARTTPKVVAPAAAVSTTTVAKTTGESPAYTPQNLYFNAEYVVDILNDSEGNKKLLVVNGEKLGYEKLQPIAELTESDLPGIFTVEWTEPNGDKWSGVATESDGTLKISIKSGDEKKTIVLDKQ